MYTMCVRMSMQRRREWRIICILVLWERYSIECVCERSLLVWIPSNFVVFRCCTHLTWQSDILVKWENVVVSIEYCVICVAVVCFTKIVIWSGLKPDLTFYQIVIVCCRHCVATADAIDPKPSTMTPSLAYAIYSCPPSFSPTLPLPAILSLDFRLPLSLPFSLALTLAHSLAPPICSIAFDASHRNGQILIIDNRGLMTLRPVAVRTLCMCAIQLFENCIAFRIVALHHNRMRFDSLGNLIKY